MVCSPFLRMKASAGQRLLPLHPGLGVGAGTPCLLPCSPLGLDLWGFCLLA